MSDTRSPVVIVSGPTASGKSALAMDLAEAFDGTVINGDSMQVYRELRLVTARPSEADMARVPHRLYGTLPAAEACSAGRWLDLARAEIEAVWAAGGLPVVVGGTGLYLRALRQGLSPIPPIDEDVRREVRALHARLGGAAFRERLAALDPASAARLETGDGQRLMRAYEVALATGRTLDEWHAEPPPVPPLAARFARVRVLPPRDLLYAAIDARFRAMVEAGALDEVRALLAQDLDPDLPAMKAVGVPDLAAAIRGEVDLETAVTRAQQASRNYAKRQLTWLRHQDAADFVVPAQYSESWRAEIIAFIRQFLLNSGP
ncbi:MAG: tRNA (adenosine(37)-N6)-dimethylallyltransferase MiaA [Hyphomicrobiales bacterium]|nr:tRNA (adenosine(37)-N6)-dimethylallyltransferase MiaA [Hyphomicrobiales bacterium]